LVCEQILNFGIWLDPNDVKTNGQAGGPKIVIKRGKSKIIWP